MKTYNTASKELNGFQCWELSIVEDEMVFFSSSFMIMGNLEVANSVRANYDLWVFGDIVVDKLEVQANLYCTGKIESKIIEVQGTIKCMEGIQCDDCFCGAELSAKDLSCNNITTYKNMVISASLNINKSLNVSGDIIVGEGIIGNGEILANRIIVSDYMAFDGIVKAKVIDLSNMKNDDDMGVNLDCNNTNDALRLFDLRTQIESEVANFVDNRIHQDTEEELTTLMKTIEIKDKDFAEYNKMFSRAIELSYIDEITNLADFIDLIDIKERLPAYLKKYETIALIFDMLDMAHTNLPGLDFKPTNHGDLVSYLSLVSAYESKFTIDELEIIYGKIYGFIGLTHLTIKRAFERVPKHSIIDKIKERVRSW